MAKNLLFLASGRGSNFQSFLDHARLGVLQNVTISALICNQKNALVTDRARRAKVPAFEIEGVAGAKFTSQREKEDARENFDRKCIEILRSYSIDLVVLAGFNQIVGKSFVEECPSRMVNVHPAYDMKKFGGRNMIGSKVHESVIASRSNYTGCSVHLVTGEVDQGPVILKQRVDVLPQDSPVSLEKKVLLQEHLLYPKAVQLFVDGRVMLSTSPMRCFVDLFSEGWDIAWTERQIAYIAFRNGLTEATWN